jgi:hypothetical protein
MREEGVAAGVDPVQVVEKHDGRLALAASLHQVTHEGE